MEELSTVKFLDIKITSASEKNILEFIITRLKNRKLKTTIFTPNSEIAVYATKHPSLKKILNSGDVNLPDGYWFTRGAQLNGAKLQGRITGVDFMQKLCERCVKEGVSIGLLGGQGGVALKTAECLERKYPGLKIEFVGEEWNDQESLRTQINQNTRKDVKENSFRPTVSSEFSEYSGSIGLLFVAFGFPKQEEWIAAHINELPVQCMMSVGGAFDFISGKVSRAPKWMQKAGFEWLYRLMVQPWRFKRQLALFEFIWLVFVSKLSLKS
jgi:N-acetylglucosaminyldiphosphoundecaprenol N-acetyl-beta-D-mannosaminyltransferase